MKRSSKPVVLVGGGGHAKVVIDALRSSGRRVLGVLDRAAGASSLRVVGATLLGGDSWLDAKRPSALEIAVGVGANPAVGPRRRIHERLRARGFRVATVVASSASVSPSARLEEGVQILTAAIIHPDAVIGTGAVINTRAVVEHDAVVGAFAFVGPGAVLCGEVRLGAEAFVGAGAVVLPGVTIGAASVIGAGSVVLRDLPAGSRVAGNPARSIGRSSLGRK